jgi:hypothetical protein
MAASVAAILARAPRPDVANARKLPKTRVWHRKWSMDVTKARCYAEWDEVSEASGRAVGELYAPRPSLRSEVLEQFTPKARRLARAA